MRDIRNAVRRLAEAGVEMPATVKTILETYEDVFGRDARGDATSAVISALVDGDVTAALTALDRLRLLSVGLTVEGAAFDGLAAATDQALLQSLDTTSAWHSIAALFDASARRLRAALGKCDPRLSDEAMIDKPDSARKAYLALPGLAAELDRHLAAMALFFDVLPARRGFALFNPTRPAHALPLIADTAADPLGCVGAFSDPGTVRGGRWVALHLAGAVLRALPDVTSWTPLDAEEGELT